MAGSTFSGSVREVLIPEITPRTAAILDNLATKQNKKTPKALQGTQLMAALTDAILA